MISKSLRLRKECLSDHRQSSWRKCFLNEFHQTLVPSGTQNYRFLKDIDWKHLTKCDVSVLMQWTGSHVLLVFPQIWPTDPVWKRFCVCVGYKLLWPANVVISLQKWCQLEDKLQRPSAYGLIQEKRIIQHEMTKTVICEWEQKKSHQMTVSGCHALKLFWRYVLTSAHELRGMVLHNSLTYSLSFERKKWQKEQETVGIECVKD